MKINFKKVLAGFALAGLAVGIGFGTKAIIEKANEDNEKMQEVAKVMETHLILDFANREFSENATLDVSVINGKVVVENQTELMQVNVYGTIKDQNKQFAFKNEYTKKLSEVQAIKKSGGDYYETLKFLIAEMELKSVNVQEITPNYEKLNDGFGFKPFANLLEKDMNIRTVGRSYKGTKEDYDIFFANVTTVEENGKQMAVLKLDSYEKLTHEYTRIQMISNGKGGFNYFPLKEYDYEKSYRADTLKMELPAGNYTNDEIIALILETAQNNPQQIHVENNYLSNIVPAQGKERNIAEKTQDVNVTLGEALQEQQNNAGMERNR